MLDWAMKDNQWGVIDINLLAHLSDVKGQAVRLRLAPPPCSALTVLVPYAARQAPRPRSRKATGPLHLGQHCPSRRRAKHCPLRQWSRMRRHDAGHLATTCVGISPTLLPSAALCCARADSRCDLMGDSRHSRTSARVRFSARTGGASRVGRCVGHEGLVQGGALRCAPFFLAPFSSADPRLEHIALARAPPLHSRAA